MPIMDQFKRGVDKAKFEADRLVRINRVQNEIGNVKREIFSVREKIAAAVIEHHKQGELLHTDLEELCATIDQFELQIAEKDAQIAAIRAEALPQMPSTQTTPAITGSAQGTTTGPVNLCPHCGFAAPGGAVFCPNCGKQIPPPPKPMVAASNPCSNCGFGLGAEAAFCPNCGQKVMRSIEAALAPEPRKCSNCRFALSAEAVFCPNCGKPAPQPSVAADVRVSVQGTVAPAMEQPSAPIAESVATVGDMDQVGDTSEVAPAMTASSEVQPVGVLVAPERAPLHCPQCGFGLPADAAFCTNCGFRLSPQGATAAVVVVEPQPHLCTNCQFELMPEAAFCPNCGQRV